MLAQPNLQLGVDRVLDTNMHNVAIELGRAFQFPEDKRE